MFIQPIKSIKIVGFIAFFPAGLGLILQTLHHSLWDYKLLALPMALMCIDQAKMAVLDLKNIALSRQRITNEQLKDLNQFDRIVQSTIILELIGFYSALQDLGWGSIIILFSQLWFNLNAKIQLHPQKRDDQIIEYFGVKERLLLIIANLVFTGLIVLWMIPVFPLIISTTIFTLVLVYFSLKYRS